MSDPDEPDYLNYLRTFSESISDLTKTIKKMGQAQLDGLTAMQSYVDDAKENQVQILKNVVEANEAVLKYVRSVERKIDAMLSILSSAASNPKEGGGRIQ